MLVTTLVAIKYPALAPLQLHTYLTVQAGHTSFQSVTTSMLLDVPTRDILWMVMVIMLADAFRLVDRLNIHWVAPTVHALESGAVRALFQMDSFSMKHLYRILRVLKKALTQ